jgi:phosphatidylglycerophosphate synthase
MNIYFVEEQKFTQWWVWLILIGIGCTTVIGILIALFRNDPENNTLTDLVLIFTLFLIVGFILLFWSMKLKTEIDQYEIIVHFFPFVKRRIAWQDVFIAEVVDYGFVGGWGIRLGTKYGTIYNIKGSKGLAIELKNGKKFLVGTQKENELSLVLDKLKNRNNQT